MRDDGDRVLSVVVPCYNEAATIRPLLGRVAAQPMVREIIVIDDASTDGTDGELAAALRDWPASGPELRVIRQHANRGKGAALRAGFRQVTAPITIVQDADLEYDPREYPRLLQPIQDGDADVVYGSRFEGFPRRVLYFWHSLGNRLLTLLSNLTTNLNLTDMETGYKAFRSDILKAVPLRSDGFGFEPEITAKVAKLGCRIYEVPISYHGRSYAEGKKIGWRDGLQAIGVILKYWLWSDLGPGTQQMTLRLLQKSAGYNRWVYQMVQPWIGRDILEIGSGLGSMTRHILGHGRVTASDISSFCLSELRRTFGENENVEVRYLDITRNSAPETGLYDTIVCLNVLEHLGDDREALQHMHRLLRPGGRLILYVPANPRLYCGIDRTVGHHRRYEMGDLLGKMRETGFQVTHQRHHNTLAAVGWWIQGKVFGKKTLRSSDMAGFDVLLPLARLQDRFESRFALSILAVGEKEPQGNRGRGVPELPAQERPTPIGLPPPAPTSPSGRPSGREASSPRPKQVSRRRP
jgi:glycosyltransferase involved in cell wall biosynthesis